MFFFENGEWRNQFFFDLSINVLCCETLELIEGKEFQLVIYLADPEKRWMRLRSSCILTKSLLCLRFRLFTPQERRCGILPRRLPALTARRARNLQIRRRIHILRYRAVRRFRRYTEMFAAEIFARFTPFYVYSVAGTQFVSFQKRRKNQSNLPQYCLIGQDFVILNTAMKISGSICACPEM